MSKNDIVSQTVAGLVHEFMEMLGSGEAGDGFNDLGANRNGTCVIAWNFNVVQETPKYVY